MTATGGDFLVLLALAALLPPVFLAASRLVLRITRLNWGEESRTGAALLITFSAILLLLHSFLPEGRVLRMELVLLAAGLYGFVEERVRVAAQVTIPCRLALTIICFFCGFSFNVSEVYFSSSAAARYLIDLPLTVIFFLGVMMSVQILDRLRGLATGVVLIASITLLSLVLTWATDNSPLILLAIGGVALGLLLNQWNERKRLGRSSQLQIAVLIGVATLGSRSWGVTLTMLAVPMLAVLLPMMDRIYYALRQFSYGGRDSTPWHLRSMLLDAGFSERWLVFFIWIVTLQAGVLVKLVYASQSPELALAAGLSAPLAAVFAAAFLMRLGDRLERQRTPEKLRILFLSHYFHPEVNAPASRLHEHARRWTAAGHEVTVICPVPNAPQGRTFNGYRNSLWHEEVVDGIRVIRVWTFLAANRGRFRRVLNYLSYMTSAVAALLLVRRHDVLVATAPQFFCGMAGAIASLFRKETFVLEIRDLWPESIEAIGPHLPAPPLRALYAIARWMYSRAACVVTVGPGYAERLHSAHGISLSRIQVIPNGVDATVFHPDAADRELLKSLGINGRFVIVYMGTIGMAHGLEVVLLAAERLAARQDIAFLLAGDGADRGRLERLAQSRALRNVHFSGLIPKHQVPAMLGACDACLVHLRRRSLFESVLPSKLFEAFGCARPVLLGVEGHAKGLLEEANAGLPFAPDDAEALAEAVRTLADDQARACTLGANGRQFVLTRYQRDQLAKDYLQVLREVREKDLNNRLHPPSKTSVPEPAAETSEGTASAKRVV
jgi:glycosyltransferase involved in cell wall biosynthesis/UDP-N-acetylmuramyl pentapeptide phosphotransferase/UDP-N-acetylglucosamine-1-phosphate transferase